MPLPKSDARTDEQRARHNAKMKRYYEAHPEQRQKAIDRIKTKYHSDPAYRERVITRAKAQRAAKVAAAAVAEAPSAIEPDTTIESSSEAPV